MRPTEIIKGKLWLGPHAASSVTSMEILRKAKITHIINCTKNLPFPKQQDLPTLKECLRVDVDDVISESDMMREKLCVVLPLIEKALVEEDGKVYVHCAMGMSRSSTVLIAYRIEYLSETLKEAYERTKALRSIIAPNPGFFKILIEREVRKCGKPSISLSKYEYINIHEVMKDWYWYVSSSHFVFTPLSVK